MVKKHFKKILLALLGTGAVVGGVVAIQPEDTAIKLDNPQVISWNKPTTDAQWAEDVKKENFDIKSTGKLEEMIASHTSKLAREEADFEKFVEMQKQGDDPVKFLYWQKRDELQKSYPDMSENELTTEAQNQAQTEYNQKLWEIEKLKQSIERMNKEVELRQKGFVVVDDGMLKLGSQGKIIRQIND